MHWLQLANQQSLTGRCALRATASFATPRCKCPVNHFVQHALLRPLQQCPKWYANSPYYADDMLHIESLGNIIKCKQVHGQTIKAVAKYCHFLFSKTAIFDCRSIRFLVPSSIVARRYFKKIWLKLAKGHGMYCTFSLLTFKTTKSRKVLWL